MSGMPPSAYASVQQARATAITIATVFFLFLALFVVLAFFLGRVTA